MLNQLPINHHLTFVFCQMCHQIGINSTGCYVQINNKQHNLNATLHLPSKVITLPAYDLKHLSKDDIDALLAHEVGHLVYYQRNIQSIDWGTVKTGIASLLFIFTALSLGRNHPDLIGVLAVCTMCPIPYFFKATEAIGECKADVLGASIIGYSKMIHLMVVANNYEVSQYNQLRYYAHALLSCPVAELSIDWLMVRFRIHYILQFFHCDEHPSYRFRVKYLKRYYRKHSVD